MGLGAVRAQRVLGRSVLEGQCSAGQEGRGREAQSTSPQEEEEEDACLLLVGGDVKSEAESGRRPSCEVGLSRSKLATSRHLCSLGTGPRQALAPSQASPAGRMKMGSLPESQTGNRDPGGRPQGPAVGLSPSQAQAS